jgi:hypothetical protein
MSANRPYEQRLHFGCKKKRIDKVSRLPFNFESYLKATGSSYDGKDIERGFRARPAQLWCNPCYANKTK